ncbi:MAG: S8 family serine peptidase [Burkholderiaceae bacterium]
MPSTADATGVRGLIVRLRDAPSHVAGAGGDGERRRAALARSDARWRGLLQASGLANEPGLRLEAVGRDAWRVVFDGGRSRARVEHWVAALAQRPEVRWAVPNEREKPLQVEQALPNDPLFLAGDQWWLWPAGGGNAGSPGTRLRGVPGFRSAWSGTTGSAATVIAVLDSGLTAHPDLDGARVLPGFDMVTDWDATAGRGDANDGDGRDGDPTDPGDWVDEVDRAVDPARYADCALQNSDWHGTAVAGFLGAATNNALGVAAATWAGRILPVRVGGKCGAEVSDIVDGMRWAAGLQVCQVHAQAGEPSQGCAKWAPLNPTPARIVNLSFGGASACNEAYQDAIDELHALGVVVIAAAGNNHGAPTRPANCGGVVGVAALNRDGFKAVYSNFGSALAIATVGGDDAGGNWGALLTDGGLQALDNDGLTVAGTPGYGTRYGTSFAAPLVAGAAALMLAADPSLTADDLVDGLRASARPHVTSPLMPTCGAANPGRCICTTATCGAGILDADQAVAYAQAHALGVRYVAPRWSTPAIDDAEVAQAVALGVDLKATATSNSTAAAANPNSPPTTGATASGTGGGALAPFELLALACGGALLGVRPRRPSRPGRMDRRRSAAGRPPRASRRGPSALAAGGRRKRRFPRSRARSSRRAGPVPRDAPRPRPNWGTRRATNPVRGRPAH